MSLAGTASRSAWSVPALRRWVVLRAVVLALAVVAAGALVWSPALGLTAVWNLGVPLLPALLVVLPGAWRNVCPLAAVALLPDSRRRRPRPRTSPARQARLQLAGAIAFLAIVPLRHVVFDRNAEATLLLLTVLAVAALAVGFATRGKSGWCSGLCPVSAAERFYGVRAAASVPMLQCRPCTGCLARCPDLTGPRKPGAASRRSLRTTLAASFAATFPGFVWGWFHVPDTLGPIALADVVHAYSTPLLAGLASATTFALLLRLLGGERSQQLERVYATASVVLYYGHRLPALFGFGIIPGDGVLIDLSRSLPGSTPALMRVASTGLVVWWMLLREAPSAPWTTLARLAPEGSRQSA